MQQVLPLLCEPQVGAGRFMVSGHDPVDSGQQGELRIGLDQLGRQPSGQIFECGSLTTQDEA